MKLCLVKVKEFQKTLKKSFELTSLTPYSENKTRMICSPASPNSGITFIVGGQKIPAKVNFLADSNFHSTFLKKRKTQIFPVGHLLAAFVGLEVDNAIIKIREGNEIPDSDLNPYRFVKKILETGVQIQKTPKKVIKILKPFKIKSPKDDSLAYFLPSENYEVTATISFLNLIGKQVYETIIFPKQFVKELSWARSFIRSPLDEKGEKWQRICKLLKILPKNPQNSPIITFDERKFLNSLRCADEPVRHKILDFIGDFSLLVYSLRGKVILYKPSHQFNHFLIKKLFLKL